MGYSGIRSAYATGRGRIVVRAVAEIEQFTHNRFRILVTEIPYQVNKARLVEKIAELVHEKRLDGISDIRDESDRNGMRIVIDLKRDVQPQVVLNFLYKHTQLQETFGVIMLALVDGQPRVLSLKEMLSYYVLHQEDVVTRRTKYDLEKSLARAHILEGLLKALDHIDEIVHVIRNSKDTGAAKIELMERFQFSDKQAQAILDMRLARLTGLERDKLLAEYNELENTIAYLRSLLEDRNKLMGVVKNELTEIKNKFNDPRRTELSAVEGEIDIADLIAVDDMVVTLTHFGYVKRLPKSTYKSQNRGGKGVAAMTTREDDYAENIRVVNSHEPIMFFTNQGRVYNLTCYQIPEAGRTAKGTAIVNLLQVSSDEKVTAMIPVPKDTQDHYLVMMTRKGMIKRTPYSEFANLRKTGLIALTLREDDELIEVKVTNADSEIFLVTRDGMCIRFKETDVRNTGRTSMGVIGMTLSDNDEIVGMQLDHQGDSLLIVSENGMGKRTSMDEFTVQHRGGKGVKCYKITEKTGYVIGVKAVTDENEIMMITTEGIIIQIRMDDVSQLGRITSGVKLINLDAGVTVAQIAKVREKVSDGNQEFDDVDDAMEDVSKPSEVDQEEDDDPAEEHITMPEETEEDE